MENKELETVDKLLSFAFAMSENMVGLSKGNYDETQFIKNTSEYLHKYSANRHEVLGVKQALTTKSKKEQAFDIIKNKRIAVYNLIRYIQTKEDPLEFYNWVFLPERDMQLTKEEFNSIIEVLKND